jgi:hypothetical protein
MVRGYKDESGTFHPIRGKGGGRMVRMRKKGSSLASLPSAGIRHTGSLTKEGYRLKASKDTRHRALEEAVGRYGFKETVDKLTALEAVNKNREETRRTIHSDIEYLQSQHAPK